MWFKSIKHLLFHKFSLGIFNQKNKPKLRNIVIFGAGEAGQITYNVLNSDDVPNTNIVAFVDDDADKRKSNRSNISVLSFHEFEDLINIRNIDELILATFTLTQSRKQEIINFCLRNNIKVLDLPPYNNWSHDSFTRKQLRPIKIEDLLHRENIRIENPKLKTNLEGKRILVTGAAGSIGSEIVRQLYEYNPEILILCDNAETPLHDLTLELTERNKNIQFIPFLCSVNNFKQMNEIFSSFSPHYVYHAAAYKHVPMMENNPVAAIENNVMGTKTIADLSKKYGVDRFVLVSTDKAVNPSNIMGASKRLAEIYVQGLSEVSPNTKFITTRFGNVLGSNGSVIHRFKKQIENGGPVTVTHPKITRYFMTIDEACSLVLEASVMGKGGEIFVFDMGSSITISDLAKKMIDLSGLNSEIEIVYTGLRPGEKLYEELLSNAENTISTYNDKIMIAKTRSNDFEQVQDDFATLFELTRTPNTERELVNKMKEIVPEFISKNSIYEDLDE